MRKLDSTPVTPATTARPIQSSFRNCLDGEMEGILAGGTELCGCVCGVWEMEGILAGGTELCGCVCGRWRAY